MGKPEARWSEQTAFQFPPQVANLPPREREVAVVLYVNGPMTAKDAHDLLKRDLSYSAFRSMLMRLCRKQVLHRRKLTGSPGSRNRRIPYIYTPAITEETVRQRALLQLAEDYFEGSLSLVFDAVEKALAETTPKSGKRAFDVAA